MKKTREIRENSRVSSGILKTIHLIAVVHFVFALYYDSTYVHFPSTKGTPNEFGGKLKYLTVVNVVSIIKIIKV